MIRLSYVLNHIEGNLITGSEKEVTFSGVSTDSRRIRKGELFFALTGENFDGHDFARDALNKGAKGVVVEKEMENLATEGEILILVPSTLKALGDLAQAWRKKFPGLRVAAVTGSNGKTTTKEMAWEILSLRFSALKNTGNLNNLIGLPLTLLKLREDHKRAVVELGMNQFGEIRRLTEIAEPEVGAITNIGKAHLGKLGSLDGIAKAKGELVERFTRKETFIINLDDPRVREISEHTSCKKITFGIHSPGAFISADDIRCVDSSALCFNMILGEESYPVRMRGIGIHNVMNALCAGGICLALGSSGDEICAGLERFSPAYMRLELMGTRFGFRIINDAYNSNPDSLRRALDELVRLGDEGKTIAVLGDMLELGGASELEHREAGKYASQSGVDFVIAYGEYGKNILEGLDSKADGVFAETHDEASRILLEVAEPGDIALVKGSRGMKMETVIQKIFKE